MFICIYSHSAKAGIQTYYGEYSYSGSLINNREIAREISLNEIKKNVLSEIGVMITSKLTIKNSNKEGEALFREDVTIITAGFIKTEVIKETYENNILYIQAKLIIDPDDLQKKKIEKFFNNDSQVFDLKKQIKQAYNKHENLLVEINTIKKELDSEKELSVNRKELLITYKNRLDEIEDNKIFELANDYFYGRKGKNINIELATQLYNDSASLGNMDALFYLANIYFNKDKVKALKFLKNSAEGGSAIAQYYYPNYFSTKEGRMFWVIKSATQGFSKAALDLGLYYQDICDANVSQNPFQQLPPHESCCDALKWLSVAGEQGEILASRIVAQIYNEGFTVEQDFKKANYWMDKAKTQSWDYDLVN
jgi:hypothetical protein